MYILYVFVAVNVSFIHSFIHFSVSSKKMIIDKFKMIINISNFKFAYQNFILTILINQIYLN